MAKAPFDFEQSLLAKVYVHEVDGVVVLTTCFVPADVAPANILCRIESAGRSYDVQRILGDNLAFALNVERGQLQ